MIILSVTLRIPPADFTRHRAQMEALVAGSRAEPGCLAYYYAADLIDPELIRVFEIYADQAALDAHRTYPHFKAWREASAPYARQERQVFSAEPIAG